jgi:hypothetical protein
VPEADPVGVGREHPRRQAFAERFNAVLEHRLQEPDLDPLGRDRVEHHPCSSRSQMRGGREHCITHRPRHPLGVRRKRLGDEERIAEGPLVELIGVDQRRLRKQRDRRSGQAAELQTRDDIRAR